MAEYGLTINFVPDPASVSSEDRHWLTITIADKDDAITMSEAAQLVDDIYNIVPCEQEGPSTGGEAANDPTEEEFAATVQQKADLNICGIGIDGAYAETLKIVRSHLCESYSLKLSRGTASGAKIIREAVEYDINIRNQSSIVLDYPVYPCPDPDDPNPEPIQIDITWMGSVYDGFNQIIKPPAIGKGCSTLNFGRKITATIRVKYTTQYDLVDVTVPGIGNQSVTSTARCFYAGMIVKQDIEPPETDDDVTVADRLLYCGPGGGGPGGTIVDPDEQDTVECYEIVDKIYRCNCSGDEDHRVTIEQTVACPDGMGCPGMESDCRVNLGSRSETADYVDCGEKTGDVSDPEYYKEICCEYPPEGIILPNCETSYIKNNGGAGIVNGADYWRAKYGNVSLIALSPKDGDCGTTEISQAINQHQCCDGVATIEWDYGRSADVVGVTSSCTVYVTGGKAPYTWQVRGDGFFTDSKYTKRDAVTDVAELTIYTHESCGPCRIEVTDGCSSVTGGLRSTAGAWVLDESAGSAATVSGSADSWGPWDGTLGFGVQWEEKALGFERLVEYKNEYNYMNIGTGQSQEICAEKCVENLDEEYMATHCSAVNRFDQAITGTDSDEMSEYNVWLCHCYCIYWRYTYKWECE